MEFLNREFKHSLSGLGSNITDNAVLRIGKCIGKMVSILQHFDELSGIPIQSGYHGHHSSFSDINKIIEQLSKTSKVFKKHPKRFHDSYSKIRCNALLTKVKDLDENTIQESTCTLSVTCLCW